MKETSIPRLSKQNKNKILEEIEPLYNIDHPNIIKYFHSFYDQK